MLNYYAYNAKGESHRSHSLSSNGKKKVGNFSYLPSDKIGKGFSSVVYRGIN